MAAATPKSPAIGQAQRFDPHSSKSVMVFVLAGHSSRVAVDFVLGRGWYSGRNGAARWREPSEVLFNTVSGEVEQAFLNAPISALVALAADPLKHFEYTDLLCAQVCHGAPSVPMDLQPEPGAWVSAVPTADSRAGLVSHPCRSSGADSGKFDSVCYGCTSKAKEMVGPL